MWKAFSSHDHHSNEDFANQITPDLIISLNLFLMCTSKEYYLALNRCHVGPKKIALPAPQHQNAFFG